ncbi:MAG: hypothetical protein ACJ8IQ_03830 [Chthoniobacterales bacterium]
MADQREPKKETVRISLPPPPGSKPPGAERRETVRINLPARPPSQGPFRPSTDTTGRATSPRMNIPPAPTAPTSATPAMPPPLPRQPPPPVTPPKAPPINLPPTSTVFRPPSSSGTAAAAAVEPAPTQPETHPRKETARISILPDPVPAAAAAPTVNMAKTQPLIRAPQDERPVAAVIVSKAPVAASAMDAIPLPILWALLGVSALTFLIQLWNYLTV